MRRSIIILTVLLIFCLSNFSINGQNVNYYKLTRIEDYGKVENQCTGGQFVKISKNVCFDSDAQGNYAGNGKLYRDASNSPADYIYKGQSFHGNAKYIFSYDYKNLIVEITPQFRYIYRLATPPSGVATCSLIKSGKSSSSGSNVSTYPSQNGYNNGYNVYYNGSNCNSNSNSSSTTNPNSNTVVRKFKCAYCNGVGRIEKNDNAPASFGINRPRQRCNECGTWYDPTVFTHYHQQCSHCGGTGYAK